MRSAVLAALVVALAVAPLAEAVGEPKQAITKADQARARSVLLQRGDLGAGFVATRQTDSELPDDPKCRSLRESDLTITGDASSPDFTLQTTGALVTVGSTAQVYRTVREANASWARGTSSQAATCLAALVRRSAGTGQRIEVVSSKIVAFPKLAPKTVAFRLVARLTAGATTATVYFDAVVVQRGRIQTGIVFTSVGRPIPRSEATTLARVVAKRLATAAGASSGPVA